MRNDQIQQRMIKCLKLLDNTGISHLKDDLLNEIRRFFSVKRCRINLLTESSFVIKGSFAVNKHNKLQNKSNCYSELASKNLLNEVKNDIF